MEPFDLTILPSYDWKKCEALGFRDRAAHLMQEFLELPEVRRMLVVGRPTTLPEMLATRRWWRPRRGEVVYRRGGRALTRVHPKAYSLDMILPDVLTPLRLRWRWWNYALRMPAVWDAIREAQRFLGFTRPVLAPCTPVSAGPVGHVDEDLVVFLADDNWLQHSAISGEATLREIKAGYDTLFRESALVIVNSAAMRESFGIYRPDLHVIPNGVSLAHFARDAAFEPPDLAAIPRPKIGYVGTLTGRVDVKLLVECATARPDYHFVLIGPVLRPAVFKPLRRYQNVHFLGDKHYDTLRHYLAFLDVATIPHAPGQFEHDGDALKLYEYLAAGLPVVSTNTGYLNPRLRPVVEVGDTPQEFLEAIDAYVALSPAERAALGERNRAAIPHDRTWPAIAKSIVDLIQSARAARRDGKR